MTDVLGASGSALYEGIKAIRQVGPAYEPLLINACRIADRLDELSDAISNEPLTLSNAKGDEVANPLLTEHRQQLLALRQVLHSLGIRELDVQKVSKKTLAETLAENKKAAGKKG